MIWSRTWRLALLATVALGGCANRGMQEPTGDGTGGTLGSGGGDPTGSGGSTGAGGSPVGSGGRGGSTGSGGSGGTTSSGGTTGTGGTTATGGTTGTGGTTATGGTTGTGGTTATGGTIGSGGVAGMPGKGGAGGNGGMPATGGSTGSGGVAGAGGRGGSAGTSGLMCPGGGVLDCSSAGALKLPGGLVTDFSAAQWDATAGQFCDPDGLRGRLFSFMGPATGSMAAVVVDTSAHSLKLNATAKDWAGGGVIFESCANVSAFTSLSFTASLTAGSLSGCSWQVQLQTQDQRLSTDTDPTGGTCASNCYRYPAVGNLATPSGTGTTYTEPFTMFNNPSSSAIATPTQVVGVQWQVTSTSSNGCTAELHIDNIKFQ